MYIHNKKLLAVLTIAMSVAGITACSKTNNSTSNNNKNMINVDIGDDAPTIDPAIAQDFTSARVLYDLFAGLAEKWDISPDGKVYTFHLRDGLKFSDGTPLTADDVVFSWQRVADPKIASPYNLLITNLTNGQAIIDGKAKPDTLGIKAIDAKTVQITLNTPNSAFIKTCSMPNLAVVSKANLTKFGDTWTNPKNMVTSGAYTVKEWVIKGHMLISKNPNYYDANSVTIPEVNFLPLVDFSSSLSQYRTNTVDITWKIPAGQFKALQQEFGSQLQSVQQEGLYYYDFNMKLPKYSSNLDLRKALSIAVDRNVLVKEVLGENQTPAYSFTTPTIEDGKFAGLDYDWAKLPRDKQIAMAQELFKKSGYGPNHPLQITISYNTNDAHKKVALAIASMWQTTFGANSIQITQGNQEWKTFLKARNTANYDIARDGWIADYNSVDSYATLYTCNSPQNNSKYCNPEFNKLVNQAEVTQDDATRIQLVRQALQIAQDDYAIIPLYQYTYTRLINPRVKNYTPDTNHLDHVQSKWYKLD